MARVRLSPGLALLAATMLPACAEARLSEVPAADASVPIDAAPPDADRARDEDSDIKTVVITGGGNDILGDPVVIADCLGLGPRCRGVIDRVGARYRELADELAADGVEDMIIVNYGRGTPLGPAAIDYSWETLASICAEAPVNCHMVDPDEVAGGRMPLRDGIHPTSWGYDILGEHLVELMEREGMRR